MEITTEHIIAYIEHRLSGEEMEDFNCLLESSPELRKEVDDIRFIFESTALLKRQKQINTEKRWKKLSQQIQFDHYKQKWLNYSRTAAAILLIPVLIVTFSLIHTLKEREQQPVEQIELKSARGLISKITLPDGSEVWLNSGSSLSYPSRFTDDLREVHLSGEAYFHVNSDKSHRFDVIVSGGIKVSAYGTEFNIYAYAEDATIETTLVDGHIEVGPPAQPPVCNINPGQQVIFNKETNKIETVKANLLVKTAWKDGKMIFRRANMSEIIQRLSRHFNVDIKLEGDELYNYEYSATFTTESLRDILLLLEKTAPIQCRIIDPEQDKDLTYSKRMVVIQTLK